MSATKKAILSGRRWSYTDHGAVVVFKSVNGNVIQYPIQGDSAQFHVDEIVSNLNYQDSTIAALSKERDSNMKRAWAAEERAERAEEELAELRTSITDLLSKVK